MSLILGGVELQPDHRRWRLWIQQGRDELPETRDYSDVIPFRRGRVHRGSIGDHRTIVLQGFIGESSEPALRSSLDALKRVLDPELEDPERLVDTLPDGSVRWIDVVPRNVMSAPGNPVWRNQSWELDALDPYWYGSNSPATFDSGLVFDSGLFFDEGAWIAITPTSVTHGIAFTNPGSADVERIRVEFTGPSTAAPGIAVDTPDGIVGFMAGAPLATGQVLAVDNFERTVTIAGASQRATLALNDANRNGEYLRLPPGPNTVRVLGQPASARLHFVPTYL